MAGSLQDLEGWEGGDGDTSNPGRGDNQAKVRRMEDEPSGNKRQTKWPSWGAPFKSHFPHQGEELGLGAEQTGSLLCALGPVAAPLWALG